MNLRTDLEERDDVSNDDIGEIIEIAQRLQREAEAKAQQLSVEELGEIAEDLDIQREYVERAIELRKLEGAKSTAEKEEKRRQRRRILLIAGGCAAFLFIVALVLARTGSNSLSEKHEQIIQAEGKLDQVLERFAMNAPHSIALLGGDSTQLTAAVAKVRSAKTTAARLEAANDLNLALADLVSAQPARDDPAAEQQRLNLHYELTGFQNRIATESQRLRSAERAYREAQAKASGKLARLFGMGPK